MNLILIAPPAAGKGTQSELICNKFAMEHVSTGNLLREMMKEDSPLGRKIKTRMDQGLLIDNDLILDIIKEKLKEDKNFIFDGFPRNLDQAISFDKILEEQNKKIDYAIYLTVDKEVAKQRIVGRLVCPNCNSVYNFGLDEVNEKHNCSKCNSELIKRKDDTLETFENRFEIYEKETSPIIEFYRNKGILKEVDSSKDPNEVFKGIEAILND